MNDDELDKYHACFARYDDMMISIGIHFGEQNIDDPANLAHIKWMTGTMRLATDKNLISIERYSADKMNRWLGYIQGILVAAFIITLSEEIEFIRETFKAS